MCLQKQLYFRLLVLFALLFVSKPFFLMAATQGTPGSTSQASFNINLSLSDAAQISYIDTASFGAYTQGSPDVSDEDDLCVYSNTAGGAYNIQASGSGVGNAFDLTDGVASTVAYRVFWNDEVSTNLNESELFVGALPLSQTGADTLSFDCSLGTVLNARVRIFISSADLDSAAGAVHSGTLTLTVTPE